MCIRDRVKVIAANGSDDDFAEYRRLFEAGETPQDEIRYLYALTDFPDEDHLAKVATMALDGSIRSQNAPFVLAQALMHREHGFATWVKIAENWDSINEQFPSNTIVRMLTGIRWLTDDGHAKQVAAFFDDKPLPQGQKQLDQHLERLRVNASFASAVQNSSSFR